MNPRIEKLLKLPAYQRGLILLAVVAVLVGGFIYLLYLPKMDELQGLRAKKRAAPGQTSGGSAHCR